MAAHQSRPDPTSAADIAAAEFGTSRKGLDPSEVRDFLRQVSREVSRLKQRETELVGELAEASRKRQLDPSELDEATVTSLVGEETARVLATAREAAAQIRGRAEDGAARLLREAQEEAARLRGDGELEAARRRQDAAKDAEAELEAARQQGREMVNEAREYRERVLADINKRREQARLQLVELAGGRERLVHAFERARLVTADVLAEFHELGIELDDEVAGGPPTEPVSVVRTDPTGSVRPAAPVSAPPVADPPRKQSASDSTIAPAGATRDDDDLDPIDIGSTSGIYDGRDDQLADPITSDNSAEPVGDTHPSPVDSESSGTNSGSDDDEDIDGTDDDSEDDDPKDDEDGDSDDDDGDSDDDDGDSDDEDEDEDDEDEDDDDSDSDSDSDSDVDSDEVSDEAYLGDDDEAGEDSDDDLGVLPDAAADPGASISDDDAELHELDDSANIPGAGEVGEDEGVAEPPSDALGAPADRFDDSADKPTVDDLFARLKASRPAAVADAVLADHRREADSASSAESATADAQPLDVRPSAAAEALVSEITEPDGVDPSREVATSGPPAADPFAQRGAVLAEIDVSLARRMKRVLADEQNDVLDLLRRKEPIATIEALLPTGTVHLASYRDAVIDEVTRAAISGALTQRDDPAWVTRRVADSAIVENILGALDVELVGPLRQRLERVVRDANGDNVEIGGHVRAIYREIKSQRLDDLASELSLAAYGRGLFAAIEPGTPLVWLADPSCADARENALAEPVSAGSPFPSGDRCPPSHAGCGCLVSPAR